MAASIASAQDAGKFGFVASTNESVGVIWQATERIAVRPAFDFVHYSSESNGLASLVTVPGLDSSRNSFEFQVSALVSLASWDQLKAYVAPGYGRTWMSTGDSDVDQSNNEAEGLLGLQYALGSRFRVFGEFGARYASLKTTTTISAPQIFLGTTLPTTYSTSDKAFGTASRFGIVFYFK